MAPASWSAGASTLEVEAGRETDLFVDPAGGNAAVNAPRLLALLDGDFQLSARVSVHFRTRSDAGALALWEDEHSWAKLCFEASPELEPTVVSVVTRRVSDDCNSFTVDADHVWLRISRLGAAYAFHASADGARWSLVRHFRLGSTAPRAGFLAQSPRGEGCVVRFDHIRFTEERLTDIRSGA